MEEIRRLKKENNKLNEERVELKVAAEKYQTRAIYVRKKFAQLKVQTEKPAINSQASSNETNKYRLKCSQLQAQLKKSNEALESKKSETENLKS